MPHYYFHIIPLRYLLPIVNYRASIVLDAAFIYISLYYHHWRIYTSLSSILTLYRRDFIRFEARFLNISISFDSLVIRNECCASRNRLLLAA